MWQCRYSGIEVPDSLWRYSEFGNGKAYSDNQAEDIEADVFTEFDRWTDDVTRFVRRKGKVPPAKFSAVDYSPPGHRWRDLKLAWRDHRMRAGHPPPETNPSADVRRRSRSWV